MRKTDIMATDLPLPVFMKLKHELRDLKREIEREKTKMKNTACCMKTLLLIALVIFLCFTAVFTIVVGSTMIGDWSERAFTMTEWRECHETGSHSIKYIGRTEYGQYAFECSKCYTPKYYTAKEMPEDLKNLVLDTIGHNLLCNKDNYWMMKYNEAELKILELEEQIEIRSVDWTIDPSTTANYITITPVEPTPMISIDPEIELFVGEDQWEVTVRADGTLAARKVVDDETQDN